MGLGLGLSVSFYTTKRFLDEVYITPREKPLQIAAALLDRITRLKGERRAYRSTHP